MVNDDVLIKYARSRGWKDTWPEQVIRMKQRMTEMKLGFPGLGNDHLELTEIKNINVGDWFIYDPYVEVGPGINDEAPILLRVLPGRQKVYVEGIGAGYDSCDPDRKLRRWMDVLSFPSDINPLFLVFRVTTKPTLNGGPAYYYFYKAFRDFRY